MGPVRRVAVPASRILIYRLVTIGILGLWRSFCNRAAKATISACARHIGAARDREKVYSCSGMANSTRADFAKGDSVVSEIASTGTPRAATASTMFTTSGA